MVKKDSNPLVSVIMATFNEPADIIKQSIESILTQTYSHLELLIADDSTHADTRAVIDKAAQNDKRVKVIRAKQRMGFVKSLDAALVKAKGQLMARMDGDDISMPNRLALQVAYAQAHPDVDVFGGSMYIINANGDLISERNYPTTPLRLKLMFIFRSPFAHPTVMFRRRIVDEGFLYNPSYKKAEDIDFFMRLYQHGYKFSNLTDKLIKYRVMGDLGAKRSRDQWRYNHQARKRFIARKPLFSVASYCVSWTYKHIPSAVFSRYYRKENTKF